MPAPLPELTDRLVALLGDGVPRSTGDLAGASGANVLAVRRALQRLAVAHRVVGIGSRDEPGRAGEREARQPVRHGVWTLPGMWPPEG